MGARTRHVHTSHRSPARPHDPRETIDPQRRVPATASGTKYNWPAIAYHTCRNNVDTHILYLGCMQPRKTGKGTYVL